MEERTLLSAAVISPRGALQHPQYDHALAPEKRAAAVTDVAEANHRITPDAEAPVRNDLAVARASKHPHPKLTRKPHHPKPRRKHERHGSVGASGSAGTSPAGVTGIDPVGSRSSEGSSSQPDQGGSSRQTLLPAGSYTASYTATFTRTSTNQTQQFTGTITFVIGRYDDTTGEFSGSLTFTDVPGAGTITQQITGVFDGFYLYVNGPADRDLSASGWVNSANAITLTSFVGSNSFGFFVYVADGGAPPVRLTLT
jgi:hypothetical protein